MNSFISPRLRCLIVVFLAVFAGSSMTVVADTIPSFTSSANSDTLQNLSGGGTLTVGALTFSNFSFFESGLTSFDPSKIHVTATFSNGIYFLTWDGNMSLVSNTGPASADLALKYSVTSASGAISAIDAAFTGSAQPGGSTYIAVDESARDGKGNVVGTTHLDVQHHNDIFSITPPQKHLDVTKDITFGIAGPNGGFVTVSEVSQSFHVIPEPSTSALLIGALGLIVLYRGLGTARAARG